MSEPTEGEKNRFPAGIPFIVGNEGAERFSYYGMRAILYVYLAALYVRFVPEAELSPDALAQAKSQATAVSHLFMAGVYAFPMVGAIMADRLLGKYPVILWVSLVYCAGHAVLAVAGRFAATEDYAFAEYGMYLGLALIAIGSGGIKPCVSANVGDQFSAQNQHLVTKVFQIFYFIINFGSFFSTILTPLLYAWYGAEVAFGVPGVFMALATLVFWLGRNRFVHVQPQPGGKLGGLDFLISTLLLTPVFAAIAAVFVEGSTFRPPDTSTEGAWAFYTNYVGEYLAHLGRHSWPYFLAAGGLVALGGVLFAVRQKNQPDQGFLAVVWYAFAHRSERKAGEGFFAPARAHFGSEAAEGPAAVLRIMGVFCMVSVFWALFDQHASTWIEQAEQMEREIGVPEWTGYYLVAATLFLALYGGVWLFAWIANRPVPSAINRGVLGLAAIAGLGAIALDVLWGGTVKVELEAAQISALNPLFVMIIIPSLNLAVFRPLERRGITVAPLRKMQVGMFLTAGAFACAALLQMRIEAVADSGDRVHVLWQVGQYFVMTTAEVLVSITGLEFAYTQAPRPMKSTIMGFWLLCVTGGNMLVALLAPMQTILSLSEFFWVFTGLMGAAAVAFAVLAHRYRGRTYLQT